MVKKDITGKTFYHLSVLELSGTIRTPFGKADKWLCACSCGKLIELPTSYIGAGRFRSCGCQKRTVGNRTEVFESYIKIFLNGSGGYYTLIDIDDYEKIQSYTWCKHKEKYRVTDFERLVYAITNIGKSQIKMHQLIIGCPDGFLRDHRDGNGLDNRKSNLRIVTHSENVNNRNRVKPVFQDPIFDRTSHAPSP